MYLKHRQGKIERVEVSGVGGAYSNATCTMNNAYLSLLYSLHVHVHAVHVYL